MFGFRPKCKEVTASELLTMFPWNLVDLGKVLLTDKMYKIPLDPAYVMRKVPSWKYAYIPEKRDCDDFCRIFRGWLSQKAWGNLLAFPVHVYGAKHDLIGFLDLEHKDKNGKHPIIFGEPQAGEMVTAQGDITISSTI